MIKRNQVLLGLVLLCTVALTLLKIPVASSQGLTLIAAPVEGELPLGEADADEWAAATAVDVPLSAQNISKPILLETKVKSLTVRALHNGSQIALLVEWSDDTQDDQMVRMQDFRDAVALQFPLVEGQPYFCMGQAGGNVNIWHWKADWQADLTARKDMETAYPNIYVDEYPFAEVGVDTIASVTDYSDPNYLPAMQAGNLFASPARPSPVEDLIAGGFGTLTSQAVEGQNVQGFGEWKDGRWRVIFSRDLPAATAEDVSFAVGKTHAIAFAVWDGANEERNGQKSTSQWLSLQLGQSRSQAPGTEAEPVEKPWFKDPQTMAVLLYGTLAVLVAIGGFIYLRLPQ
jgi:hypothetical protein